MTIHIESHPTEPWWRWWCPCGRHGVWLNHMNIAWRNALIHGSNEENCK
jgi:hypothetical protein